MSSLSVPRLCSESHLAFAKHFLQAVGLVALSMAALWAFMVFFSATFGQSVSSLVWHMVPLGPYFALGLVSLLMGLDYEDAPLLQAYGLVFVLTGVLCAFPQAFPGAVFVRTALAATFIAGSGFFFVASVSRD